jgi:hypothetical protein
MQVGPVDKWDFFLSIREYRVYWVTEFITSKKHWRVLESLNTRERTTLSAIETCTVIEWRFYSLLFSSKITAVCVCIICWTGDQWQLQQYNGSRLQQNNGSKFPAEFSKSWIPVFQFLSLCMLPNKIFSYDFAVTTEFAVINVADDSTGAFDQPNPLPFKFKLHCSHLERCFS